MLRYKQTKNWTSVTIDGLTIGIIINVDGGYQYVPQIAIGGQLLQAGTIYPTEAEVRESIELLRRSNEVHARIQIQVRHDIKT